MSIEKREKINSILLIATVFLFALFCASFLLISIRYKNGFVSFLKDEVFVANNIKNLFDINHLFGDEPIGFDWIKDSNGNLFMIDEKYIPFGGIFLIILLFLIILSLISSILCFIKFNKSKDKNNIKNIIISIFCVIPFIFISLSAKTLLSDILFSTKIRRIIYFVYFLSGFSLPILVLGNSIINFLQKEVKKIEVVEEEEEDENKVIKEDTFSIQDVIDKVPEEENKAPVIEQKEVISEEKIVALIRETIKEELSKEKRAHTIIQYFSGVKLKESSEPNYVLKENIQEDECDFEIGSYETNINNLDDNIKKYYDQIKSKILGYGLKSKISNSHELFRYEGKTYIIIKALKKLKIYYALEPKNYLKTKYSIIDVSDIAKYESTPVAFKVKNNLNFKRALELIDDCLGFLKKDEDLQI